ncbi:MAG: hypothetical protein QM541_17270 [Flavobacterium sp.]|nr:hypothetical protein [Flavobacterium sp.]
MYYEKCTKHEAIKTAEQIINPTTQTIKPVQQSNDRAMFLEKMFTYFRNAVRSNYEILVLFGTNGFTEEHQNCIRASVALEEIIFPSLASHPHEPFRIGN